MVNSIGLDDWYDVNKSAGKRFVFGMVAVERPYCCECSPATQSWRGFRITTRSFPANPHLSFLSRLRNFDLTAGQFKVLQKKYLPYPPEVAHPGTSIRHERPFRANTCWSSEDIDPAAVTDYREYIERLLRWQGKPRFLTQTYGICAHPLSRPTGSQRTVCPDSQGRQGRCLFAHASQLVGRVHGFLRWGAKCRRRTGTNTRIPGMTR